MSGFDHRDPEIEALMETRSRAQGVRLVRDYPHELVFNTFEMRRREAAVVDPLGVDDTEPWIPASKWVMCRGGIVRFNPSDPARFSTHFGIDKEGTLEMFVDVAVDTSQVLAALERAADSATAALKRLAFMDPEPG